MSYRQLSVNWTLEKKLQGHPLFNPSYSKIFLHVSFIKVFVAGVADIAPSMIPKDTLTWFSWPFRSHHSECKSYFLIWSHSQGGFFVAIISTRWVSELMALSCKEPLLVLHMERASFCLKLISTLSRILNFSFCPTLKDPKEISLNCLTLVYDVRVYLSATASIKQLDSLFVLPQGSNMELSASHSSIARWIRPDIRLRVPRIRFFISLFVLNQIC